MSGPPRRCRRPPELREARGRHVVLDEQMVHSGCGRNGKRRGGHQLFRGQRDRDLTARFDHGAFEFGVFGVECGDAFVGIERARAEKAQVGADLLDLQQRGRADRAGRACPIRPPIRITVMPGRFRRRAQASGELVMTVRSAWSGSAAAIATLVEPASSRTICFGRTIETAAAASRALRSTASPMRTAAGLSAGEASRAPP